MRTTTALAAALVLAGCSSSYSDLEEAFPAPAPSNAPALDTKSIVLTSRTRRGAESYDGLVTIRLSTNAVMIENAVPFNGSIEVPVDEITGCSMTCFGTADQHIDLIIARTGTTLMIPRSKALMEWCWNARRPMISGKSKREWEYKGVALPGIDSYAEQLNSRQAYDEQAVQSCLGF
jgi:hypothetical protein